MNIRQIGQVIFLCSMVLFFTGCSSTKVDRVPQKEEDRIFIPTKHGTLTIAFPKFVPSQQSLPGQIYMARKFLLPGSYHVQAEGIQKKGAGEGRANTLYCGK